MPSWKVGHHFVHTLALGMFQIQEVRKQDS